MLGIGLDTRVNKMSETDMLPVLGIFGFCPKNHEKCLKGLKQRGISANLCFKDDSVYTWDEHSL